jgi:hypothetical protein
MDNSRHGGDTSRHGGRAGFGVRTLSHNQILDQEHLLEILAPNYIASTTTSDRAAHLQVYNRLMATSSIFEMSTSAMPDTEHVTLHLAFRDRPGSLSAIAACLGEHGINIVHVSAFCTTTSIAIDTVEVNTFTPAAAESIKSRIQELNAKAAPEPATGGAKRDEQGLKDSDSTSVADDEKLGSISPAKAWLAGENELVSVLPLDYVNATTPEERASHQEMYALLKSGTAGNVVLRWATASSNLVLLHIIFVDCLGSLSTITSVLNDRGINVKRVVAFSTDRGVAVDTFHLSVLDQATADIVEASLAAQIAHEQHIEIAVEAGSSMFSLSHNAVSFTIHHHHGWGLLGGHYKETLTIGDNWIGYGRQKVEAAGVLGVHHDKSDPCTLQLNLLHQKRPLTISFPGGVEQCKRAFFLLSRVHKKAAFSGDSSFVGDKDAQSAMIDGFGSGGGGSGGSADAPTPRREGCHCTSQKLFDCLAIFIISVAGVYALQKDVLTDYQPAACTVLGIAPVTHLRFASGCKQLSNCAFYTATPGWDVQVRLISPFPHPHPHGGKGGGEGGGEGGVGYGGGGDGGSDLASYDVDSDDDSYLDPTVGSKYWSALAVPSFGDDSNAERASVKQGSCSGETFQSANHTTEMCRARYRVWAPDLHDGFTYSCFTAGVGAPIVYFVEPTSTKSFFASMLTILIILGAVFGACICLCAPQRSQDSAHELPSEGNGSFKRKHPRSSGDTYEEGYHEENGIYRREEYGDSSSSRPYAYLPQLPTLKRQASDEAFLGAARAAGGPTHTYEEGYDEENRTYRREGYGDSSSSRPYAYLPQLPTLKRQASDVAFLGAARAAGGPTRPQESARLHKSRSTPRFFSLSNLLSGGQSAAPAQATPLV